MSLRKKHQIEVACSYTVLPVLSPLRDGQFPMDVPDRIIIYSLDDVMWVQG